MAGGDKAEVLFHPVRFRVVQAFVGAGPMTVRELAEWLPEVPQASLYRHVSALVESNMLLLVEERRAGRGAAEKIYDLNMTAATLTADDLAGASREDHLRYFTTFLAGLLWDFEQYLQRTAGEQVDLLADRVGYRQTVLYLSDAELDALVERLQAAVRGVAGNTPAAGRRRRVLTTVLMPVDDFSDDAGGRGDASS
jgi:DNA-binding transcriptional ArsR family regulator